MRDRLLVTVRSPVAATASIPVCYRVMDTRMRAVEEGVLVLGEPHAIHLPPGDYALRLFLPSGAEAGGDYIRVGGPDVADLVGSDHTIEYRVDPDELSFDLAPDLARSDISPVSARPHSLPPADTASFLVPHQALHTADFRRPVALTPWARLWERHEGVWRVSPRAPSSITSSPTATFLSYGDLPSTAHLIQVGSDRAPWRFLRLPSGERLDVTIRPVGSSAPQLQVAVTGQDKGAYALMGYLTQGAHRHAELMARHLVKDLAASTALRWTAIGYHLLRKPGSRLSDELLQHVLSARSHHPANTDLAVISAWHLLERMRAGIVEPSHEAVARGFLAAAHGLPECTEGLRLLVDGLRLLDGPDHRAPLVHGVLVQYGRYLATADASSPLLAFHGEHPEAPGPAIATRGGMPDGAFPLVHPMYTGPVAADVAIADSEPSAYTPVEQARSLLARLPAWRLRPAEWEEVAHALQDCAGAVGQARSTGPSNSATTELTAVEGAARSEPFTMAVRQLSICAAAQRPTVDSVPPPAATRTQAQELLTALAGLAALDDGMGLDAGRVDNTTTYAPDEGEQQRDPATVNAEMAELVNSARDMGDPDLLHASIDMLRGLKQRLNQDDPVRPVVLVNLGHALQELYRWTRTRTLIEEAVECVAEAVALTPAEESAHERRRADLEAIRALLRVGLSGKAQLVNRTSTAVSGTLELTFQGPEHTMQTPRRERAGRGSGRPAAPRPSGPLPPDPDTPRPVPPESDDTEQWAEAQKKWRLFRPPLRPLPRYDYEHYSRLAGPLTQAAPGSPYQVRHRSLLKSEPHRIRVVLALTLAPLASLCALLWLLQPAHWLHRPPLGIVMVLAIGAIEGARLISVVSSAHATLVARDPVPVVPETGTRVAFLTTFVPGKEPLQMLSNTLSAAVRVRHRGLMHVWVLDEGDDPEVRALCERLGVLHFSRKGVMKWNQVKGVHRAKTKHGNYNAWLDAHGGDYDFVAAVDTDHAPLPNFLERTLGFFRDADVAFVVSPQVYGNYDNIVTKFAESQQFMFHALIQRAGNRYRSAMLVGTNVALRTTALLQAGGFQDSITEDLDTGLAIHQLRNPSTGRHWTSVYTPDVLAVGEGPASWTDFMTQQLRWSRGTYEALLKHSWRAPRRLRPASLINYAFLLAWYPLLAISWILGGVSLALYFALGASGADVDPGAWALVYGSAVALQLALYVWNRRHNVSPHEPAGSSGLAGMTMTLMTAPVYTRSLMDALLRRRSRFVVTPKGSSASPDTLLGTFRIQLFWAVTVTALAAYGVSVHHTHPAMLVWAALTVAVSLSPIALWLLGIRKHRQEWSERRSTQAEQVL